MSSALPKPHFSIESGSRPGGTRPKGLRVLFADDEKHLRDLMQMELPRMGHADYLMRKEAYQAIKRELLAKTSSLTRFPAKPPRNQTPCGNGRADIDGRKNVPLLAR